MTRKPAKRIRASRLLSLVFALATTTVVLSEQANSCAYAQPSDGAAVAAAIQAALVEIIERAEPSVVSIARYSATAAPPPLDGGLPRAKPADMDIFPSQYGTGVVLERNGLILTHYEVVKAGSEHWVTTSDRKTYRAQLLGADPRSQLATLKIDSSSLVPVKLGDASKVRKGNFVITMGNPYAIARDGQASAGWGMVSNLLRKAGPVADSEGQGSIARPSLHNFGTLIQTDAKLNLGTSGGPMLNLKGEMIGLITALAATSGYERSAGYAIPVDKTFRRVIEDLKHGREVEYGFLGVWPENLSLSEIRAGRTGARVYQSVAGTPAFRAGIRRGDVVTHIDGKPIFDADELVLRLGSLPVETAVRLTIDRRGRKETVPVLLSKYPVRGKQVVTAPKPDWRGLRVDYITALPEFTQLARQGRFDPDGCVAIVDVETDSPAWRQGLRPKMCIATIAGRRVATPREFHRAVEGQRGTVELSITGGRGDEPTHRIPPASRPRRAS
ncbi:MAG: trypsin-like peptidase domain-containing protein [Pirellulales bacterium]|nr:trypsin-like peptidase domain-containing protein [Pirellulales bacterium]